MLAALLGACELGSTEDSGGASGPTETAPTGPTETAPTAATGPTGIAVLEGTWNGTWGFEQLPDAGTFSMEIGPTGFGFSGTIQIDESQCVSAGTVTIGLEGDRIEIGGDRRGGGDHVHGHHLGGPHVRDLERWRLVPAAS